MRPLARGEVFVICFIMKLLLVLLQICTQTPVHRRCCPAHSIWKRSRPERKARASALLLLQLRFASVDHFRVDIERIYLVGFHTIDREQWQAYIAHFSEHAMQRG